MKTVKVLGTGCANCRNTMALIERVAHEKGASIVVQKIEDLPSIVSYGVIATPGVVIDEVIVHAGGVPERSKVESWF